MKNSLPFLPGTEAPSPGGAPRGRERGGSYEPPSGIGAPSGTQGPGTRGDSRKDKPSSGIRVPRSTEGR